MKIEYAAQRIISALAPHCDRIEIAGSIRREAPAGDIDIVCVPSSVPGGLFGGESQRSPGFVEIVQKMPRVKGEPTGKMTSRSYGPFNVEIYMVDPRAYGYQLMIRTGPSDFAKEILAMFNRRGFSSKGGFLEDDKGSSFSFENEIDVFNYLELAWIPPKHRGPGAIKYARTAWHTSQRNRV